jgi:hypothetical protein
MAVNRLLCASPKIQVDAAFQGAREAPAVPNPCPNGTELVGLNTRAEEPKPSSEALARPRRTRRQRPSNIWGVGHQMGGRILGRPFAEISGRRSNRRFEAQFPQALD